MILKSPQADNNEVMKRYGRIDHLKVWQEKWGFRYSIEKRILGFRVPHMKIFNFLSHISRRDYKRVRARYKNSLVDLFYLNNPKFGAVKSFIFGEEKERI